MVLLGLLLIGNCNVWFAYGGILGNWCFGWFLLRTFPGGFDLIVLVLFSD